MCYCVVIVFSRLRDVMSVLQFIMSLKHTCVFVCLCVCAALLGEAVKGIEIFRCDGGSSPNHGAAQSFTEYDIMSASASHWLF